MEKFISIADAAESFGVSSDTVLRLIHGGELIGIRVGGQMRISARDFDAYVLRARRIAIYGLDSHERRRAAEQNPTPAAPKAIAPEDRDFPGWGDVLDGVALAFGGNAIAPLHKHPQSGELLSDRQVAEELAEAKALHQQVAPKRPRRTKTAPAPAAPEIHTENPHE